MRHTHKHTHRRSAASFPSWLWFYASSFVSCDRLRASSRAGELSITHSTCMYCRWGVDWESWTQPGFLCADLTTPGLPASGTFTQKGPFGPSFYSSSTRNEPAACHLLQSRGADCYNGEMKNTFFFSLSLLSYITAKNNTAAANQARGEPLIVEIHTIFSHWM